MFALIEKFLEAIKVGKSVKIKSGSFSAEIGVEESTLEKTASAGLFRIIMLSSQLIIVFLHMERNNLFLLNSLEIWRRRT